MTLDKEKLIRDYREWARSQRRLVKRAEKALGIKLYPVDEHHCDLLDGPCDYSVSYSCYRNCFHRLPVSLQESLVAELKTRGVEPLRQPFTL